MEKLKYQILGGFFSSTMWFGLLVMVATWMENNTQFLQGLVESQYAELVGYAIGALIWLLRWITTKPLYEKSPAGAKAARTGNENENSSDDNFLKDF